MTDQPTKLPISTTAIPSLLQREPLPPGAKVVSESEETKIGQDYIVTEWSRCWDPAGRQGRPFSLRSLLGWFVRRLPHRLLDDVLVPAIPARDGPQMSTTREVGLKELNRMDSAALASLEDTLIVVPSNRAKSRSPLAVLIPYEKYRELVAAILGRRLDGWGKVQ